LLRRSYCAAFSAFTKTKIFLIIVNFCVQVF
jgi:hypothetical protein